MRVLVNLSNHQSTGFGGNVDSPIHSISKILQYFYIYEEEQQKHWDEKKTAAIKWIIKESQEIASAVLIDLLFNNSFGWASIDRNGNNYPSTFPEYMRLNMQYEFPTYISNALFNNYLTIAIEFAKENFIMLEQLFSKLDNCSEDLIYEIIKLIDSEMVINLEDERRYEIWGELKSFIQKNRYFKTAEWAKSDECLNKIEIAASKIMPRQNILKAAWYFVNNDITEEPWNDKDYDYRAENERRLKIRKAQIINLISTDGVDSAISLYKIVKEQNDFTAVFSVAFTLAELNDSDIDHILLPGFLLAENDRNFIQTYINHRFKDEQNADQFIENAKISWDKNQLCNFASSLAFKLSNEKLTSLLGDDVNLYWSKIDIISSDKEILEKYLSNERYDLLFRIFYFYPDNINDDIIIKTLKKVLSLNSLPVNWWSINKQLERMIVNESIDDNVKENLEWLNLKFFSPYDRSFRPNNLFKKLDNNINYLCDIINQAYDLSEKYETGSAAYLLWLWCPKFEDIPVFGKWYCDIIGMLDDKPAKYFQKYLGRKLFRRNPDKNIAWLEESILPVINDSSAMSSSYSYAARGIGDLNDLCLEIHGEEFDNTLKNDVPFWREKAEEVDNLGYYKFATVLRLIADDIENPKF